MSLKSVITKSKYDKNKRGFLRKSLESFSIGQRLNYILYRAKYPLLMRISTRLLILIELYFVYSLFSRSIFIEVGLFLILILLQKASARGIFYALRPQLVKANRSPNKKLFNALLMQSVAISNTAGIILGFIFSLLLVSQIPSSFESLFYLSFFLILTPIQNISGTLWSAIYTKHREYRSFSKVMIIRLLPLLCLLAFSNIGAISYLAGIFISRLIEQSYLIAIATKTLNIKTKELLVFASIKSVFYRLKVKSSRVILLSAIAIPLFDLVIAMLINSRSSHYFIIHCTIFFLFRFFTALIQQTPRTLLFDVYFALIKGRVFLAKTRARELLQLGFYSATIISITIFLILTSQYLAGIFPEHLRDYWLYIIIFLIIRSLAELKLGVFQIASNDFNVTNILYKSFFSVIFVQIVLTFFLTTNLQTYYFVELMGWTYLLLSLAPIKELKTSPYLKLHAKKSSSWPLLPANTFQLILKNALTSGCTFQICEMDEWHNHRENIKLLNRSSETAVACKLIDNYYLLLSKEPITAPLYCRRTKKITFNNELDMSNSCMEFILSGASNEKTCKKITQAKKDNNNRTKLLAKLNLISGKVLAIMTSQVTFKNPPLSIISRWNSERDILHVGYYDTSLKIENKNTLAIYSYDKNLYALRLNLTERLKDYFKFALAEMNEPQLESFTSSCSSYRLRALRRLGIK